MPYIYQCVNCYTETNLGYPPAEVHSECEDCGIAMCESCASEWEGIPVCEDCAKIRQSDEAKDKLEKESE